METTQYDSLKITRPVRLGVGWGLKQYLKLMPSPSIVGPKAYVLPLYSWECLTLLGIRISWEPS